MQFAVLNESPYRAFCEALKVFWETEHRVRTIGLCENPVRTKEHLPVPGIFSSFLLHFSVIFFLLQVPFSIFSSGESRNLLDDDEARPQVYDLKMIKLSDYFPVVRPGGPGGQPGRGVQLREKPARGGTLRHPRLKIVSNPPHPDNTRQTIIQPKSPELRIPVEIPLPNLVLSSRALLPQLPAERKPPPPAPVFPQVEPKTAKAVTPKLAELRLAPSPSVNRLATLQVPSAPIPRVPAPTPPPQNVDATQPKQISELPLESNGQDTRQLIALGINPSPPADSIVVPAGQRFGAFSVSDSGGSPGSPGGSTGGTATAGVGGGGTGGDASVGVGAGGHGGGHGAAEAGITVSATTEGSVKSGASGIIFPSGVAALVYPVSPPPHPTHPGIVVTAGPAGGGGLSMYGVLRGGKIYTTYLPMPGKNWILQYCAHSAAAQDPPVSPRTVEVRLEAPLVPPSAQDQFDFHRPPLPNTKSAEMIVLKGLIHKDGTVDSLSVLQGLGDTADQAALVAFGRWKFRPATQGGKPIEVEILVGIPALAPGL